MRILPTSTRISRPSNQAHCRWLKGMAVVLGMVMATDPALAVLLAQTSPSRTASLLALPRSTIQRPTETRPLVQMVLRATTGTLRDEAYVYFENGATAGFDSQYDAVKLPNSTGLNLALIAGTAQLSINGLPIPTASVTVPLFVGLPVTGTYTLEAGQLLNFAPGAQPFLRDLQLNTLTDLSQQPTYTFTMNATSTAPRFELVFGAQVLGTVSAELAAQTAVYPNPAAKLAFVELPASLRRKAVTATLVDDLGREVLRQVLSAGSGAHRLALATVAVGAYALHLQTEAGVIVKKLVVE
jgi:hypothetical protein